MRVDTEPVPLVASGEENPSHLAQSPVAITFLGLHHFSLCLWLYVAVSNCHAYICVQALNSTLIITPVIRLGSSIILWDYV